MTSSRTLLLFLFVITSGSYAGQPNNDVRAYIQTKARYDTLAQGHGLTAAAVPIALKDLEKRMRRILGPDSLPGWTERFNLTWLPCCDPGGWGLDGMVFSDAHSRVSMVVTAPGILDAWLEQIGQKTADPLVGLSAEDALTWVLYDDEHVYRFVDLKSTGQPHEVFLATLVARSNGDLKNPDEVVVGVNAGRRIYIIFAPAAARIDLTSQCGPLDDATRSCFRRLAPSQPNFPKLLAQARALAALVTPRR